MDRGAWRATVHGAQRVGHDWSYQHQHVTWQSHSWTYIQKIHGSKGHPQPSVHCSMSVTAKTWRQPNSPPADGWGCDTQIQGNATQPLEDNEIMPFTATWTDLGMITLSKSDKDKYHTISPYMGNLEKNDTNELIYKQSHRIMVTKG